MISYFILKYTQIFWGANIFTNCILYILGLSLVSSGANIFTNYMFLIIPKNSYLFRI